MLLAATKRDLRNGRSTTDGMHPYSSMTQASLFSKHFMNYGVILPTHFAQRAVTCQSPYGIYGLKVDFQPTVVTSKKLFHLSEKSFLQDVEIITFPRLSPSSSLPSIGYAKMFMALFRFLLLKGYTSSFGGDGFRHPLLAMATESGLKLQQKFLVHLA